MIEICELDTEPVFSFVDPSGRVTEERSWLWVAVSKDMPCHSTAQRFLGRWYLRPSLEVPPLIDQRKRGNCFPSQWELVPLVSEVHGDPSVS